MQELIVVCDYQLHCLVETIPNKKFNLLFILVRIIDINLTQGLSIYKKAKKIKKLWKFISEKFPAALDMIFKIIFWIDAVTNW